MIEVGDYVSLNKDNEVLYKVLEVKNMGKYTFVCILDVSSGEYCFERSDYITGVFKVKEIEVEK